MFLTIWPWRSGSYTDQGHIPMWQTGVLVLSNIVFKYGVNPFKNKEIMGNINCFWQFDLEFQGH